MSLRLALAVLLVAAAPAAAQDERALLERHAPVLHYDARDRDRATSVAALAPDLRGEDTPLRATTPAMPDVAHGRVARGSDGRRWLQYWLLYADNTQDRGVVRTGRHLGDWEVVQVALDRSGRPVEATYAQHKWAEACPYRGPTVRSNGSHGRIRGAGHDRPWPDPTTRPGGRAVVPRVEPFGRGRAGRAVGETTGGPRAGERPARVGRRSSRGAWPIRRRSTHGPRVRTGAAAPVAVYAVARGGHRHRVAP
jgi:hypothetical protein